MSQAINKEDIISGSPFKDIAEEMQVALGTLEKFDAKIINIATHLQKDLVASNQKTLQSIEAVNKAELEAEKLLLAKIKTQQAELKLQEQQRKATEAQERSQEKANKATERAINLKEKENSAYSRVDKILAKTIKDYRDLAIKKELNLKISDKEIARMETLAGRIAKYDTALKNVDATTGKYQRNVGNYKSTFDGMTFSVTQLAREMPAFGNSVQTGFMAISNNLPMFFDEIQKLKQANIELAKSGEPTKSVFKTLAGSLMSTQVLLSVGVTLLTLYGAKLVEFVFSSSEANKAIEQQNNLRKAQNEEMKKSAEFLAKETNNFVGLILRLRESNANSKERNSLIKEINKEYGTTLTNMNNELYFQLSLNSALHDYITFQRLKYRLTATEEKRGKLLEREFELENQLRKIHKDAINAIKAKNFQTEEEKKFIKEKFNLETMLLTQSQFLNTEQYDKLKEIKIIRDELESLTKNELYLLKEIGKYNFKDPKDKDKVDKQKQLNTELQYTNDYISEQLKLLKELQDINNKDVSDLMAQQIEDNFRNLMKKVTETGEFEVDYLEYLIEAKSKLDKSYIDERTIAEIESIEFVYDAEMKLRRATLDAKYRDLLAQENLTAEARLEIENNYNKALEQLDNEELSRYNDLQTKIVIIKKKSEAEKTEIDKQANEDSKNRNEELIQAQIDFYKKQDEQRKKDAEEKKKKDEAEKKRLEEQLQVFQQIQEAITDFLKQQIDQRIALLQKESDFAKSQQDYLQNLAAQGNIFAEQSIAEQIQIQRDAQEEQMRLEKQKQNLDMISTGLKTFEGEISKGKSPAEALATTLVTTKTLVGLLSNLNFFAKGTDNAPEGYAVTDEQGAELHLDKQGNIKDFGSTKGAQMKYLEKGDKIITASKTAQIFSEISNAKKIASVKDVAGNSYDLKPLLQEMQGMRNDIKNNATQIKVHWDTMGNIIEQVTKGNDRVTNRYRVKQ
jgi:hypothetical protein